jgi:DNA integrity scanning protein DisA with diadenylate cyclase activity
MNNSKQAIKNFLRFYYEPELNQEEIEEELKELGVDIKRIKRQKDDLIKNLEQRREQRKIAKNEK